MKRKRVAYPSLFYDSFAVKGVDKLLRIATGRFVIYIIAAGQGFCHAVCIELFVFYLLPKHGGSLVQADDFAEVHVRRAVLHDDVVIAYPVQDKSLFDFMVILFYILLNRASSQRRAGFSFIHQ